MSAFYLQGKINIFSQYILFLNAGSVLLSSSLFVNCFNEIFPYEDNKISDIQI